MERRSFLLLIFVLRAHSSMVEQFPFKEAVEGSNPSGLTRLTALAV